MSTQPHIVVAITVLDGDEFYDKVSTVKEGMEWNDGNKEEDKVQIDAEGLVSYHTFSWVCKNKIFCSPQIKSSLHFYWQYRWNKLIFPSFLQAVPS